MIRSDSIGEIMIRAGRKDRDSDENPRWYTVQKQAMTKTKNRQQKKAHHHKGSILLHISHKPLSFSHLALNAPLIRFMIPLIPSPRLLLYTHSLHRPFHHPHTYTKASFTMQAIQASLHLWSDIKTKPWLG